MKACDLGFYTIRDDFDIEDAIVEEIRLCGRQDHISYFAFTATPKNKTLELFGRQTHVDL